MWVEKLSSINNEETSFYTHAPWNVYTMIYESGFVLSYGTNSSKKKVTMCTLLIYNSTFLCDLLMKLNSRCLVYVSSACYSFAKKKYYFL